MSCGANLNYKNIIFKIVKINRLKENHTYIFAGNVKKEIQKILEKYESKKNLLKKEKDDLEKYYGKKNLGNLFSIKTKKFSIIYESIFIDDSITNIRRKIFAFLSKSNDLILEQNQELWVKMKKGDTKILGFKYENLEFLPSLYQKLINQELINQELNLTREDIKSYCTKTNYYNEKSEKVKYNNATFICEQKFFNKGTKTFIMLFLKIKKGEYEYELCFVTTHLPFNKDETKTLQGFDKRIKQLIKIKECFNEFKNKLNMDNPVLFIMGDLNFRCNFNQLYFNEKFNEKLQVNKLNNLQNILNGNETKFLDKYKKFSEYHFLNGKFEIDDTNNYYNQIKRNINKLRNNKLQYIDELKKYDELTIFLKICKRLNQTNIKSISNNRLIDYIAGSINILNNAQKLFIFFTFLRFLKKGNDDLDFFSKFAEGKDDKGPEFEPTCKYENERLIYKGTNDKYPRLPSWYDRILYKKSDKYSIYCTEYKSKGGNTKSDHKWVMGEYIITNKY